MKKGEIQMYNSEKKSQVWPKKLPELTDEQIRIKNEWMKYWHEVLPNKYGIIEKFNHGFPVKMIRTDHTMLQTLEVGAGLGGHIAYENLENQQYSVIELRDNMVDVLRKKYPKANTYVGDIQKRTEFNDRQFDRIIAIHLLEHLPDLPSALREIHRILKDDGQFTAVIPCEGGLAYGFARYISSNRIFKKKFKMKYGWLMKTEHVNQPNEIINEIKKEYIITKTEFFPLKLPFVFCNLCIGLDMVKN
jgi:ubiquinone/menaquinone biosynthesis C-methylase UbiE